MFTSPMNKSRHKKRNNCKPPEKPSPLWYCTEVRAPEVPRPEEVASTSRAIVPVQTATALSALYLNEKRPIFGEDGIFLTYMRANDGFINATEMCTKTETKARHALRPKDYKKHITSNGTLEARAVESCVPSRDIIQNCSNAADQTHTWIHPCLVTDFLTWCGLKVNLEAIDTLSPFVKQTSERVFLQSIYGESDELITEMRMSDGFINAAKMCEFSITADGTVKQLSDWKRKYSDDLLGLSMRLHNGEDEAPNNYDNILQVVSRGRYSGSWLHPRAAVQLAKWCVVKFNTQSKRLINRYLPHDMHLDIRKPQEATIEVLDVPTVLDVPEVPQAPELRFLQSLTGDDGQMVTEMRTSDGFINATKMCNSACTRYGHKKKFADWEDSNSLFLESLATELPDSQVSCNRLENRLENHAHNKRQAYNHLIEVVHGGTYRGSWVHPRIAIKLAAWCSVKFDVQTNGILSRYTKGEVTTEESQAVASAIQSNIDEQLVPSHPLPMGYPDVTRPLVIDRTLGIPTHALPPNVAYVIRLGSLSDGQTLDKYGRTTNFAVRMGSHEREHPGCQILMIVTTGTHDSKPIEDTLRTYFNENKIDVEKPNGKMLTECFKSMSDIEYIDKARELLLRTHANIIETIHFDGEVYDFRTIYGKDALAIEQEKTKQSEELTKQSEELTKQLAIKLELAKMGIEST